MKRGSIFELNGIPKFQEALPLALQHVVAMIVGCVTPAIIVAGAVGGDGLSAKDRVILIQASLVVSALSTLIQLFPIGKKKGFNLGSGLPMIMGVLPMYRVCRQSQKGTESVRFWEHRSLAALWQLSWDFWLKKSAHFSRR